MTGLSRDLVELKLLVRTDKRPVKQTPRRFAPEVLSQIKEEIERLPKNKFIRPAKYVECITNIVLVIKNNGTLKVCTDFNFRSLNDATLKDEYPILVAKMLVDSVTVLSI